MRRDWVLSARVLALIITPTIVAAQGGEQRGPDPELVPYHQHRDTRHGHDHSYPDRGSIIRDVPKTAIVVNYAGLAYRFDDGIWYEPRGPAFMVVAPPIGLIVASLPTFSSVIARNGKTLLYCNDTYYLPRPDIGGYEVVNDPSATSPDAATSAAAPAVAGAAASTEVFATPLLESAAAKATPLPAAVPAVPAVPAPAPATASMAPAATAPTTFSSGSVPTQLAAGSSPAGGASLAAIAAPGSSATDSSADSSRSGKALIYPKNGQSPDQQARDRYECYRFGVAQSGFDPMHPTSGSRPDAQADYERAQGVCLDAHGYSVH